MAAAALPSSSSSTDQNLETKLQSELYALVMSNIKKKLRYGAEVLKEQVQTRSKMVDDYLLANFPEARCFLITVINFHFNSDLIKLEKDREENKKKKQKKNVKGKGKKKVSKAGTAGEKKTSDSESDEEDIRFGYLQNQFKLLNEKTKKLIVQNAEKYLDDAKILRLMKEQQDCYDKNNGVELADWAPAIYFTMFTVFKTGLTGQTDKKLLEVTIAELRIELERQKKESQNWKEIAEQLEREKNMAKEQLLHTMTLSKTVWDDISSAAAVAGLLQKVNLDSKAKK